MGKYSANDTSYILLQGFTSINVEVWVAYKETNWIAVVLWIVLSICLGRSKSEPKCACLSITTARLVFVGLGCLMLATLLYTLLTDGSPFRKELLTPWLTATLIDFYANVIVIAVGLR